MSETITFDTTHFYDTRKTGIHIAAILRHGDESVSCEAKLDTGSSHCIFERSYGELLGLNVESSSPVTISTVTGSFFAHPHTITIEVLGVATEAIVFFAAEEYFTRNVLGRTGWLDRVKLGLIDYEGKLLLSLL